MIQRPGTGHTKEKQRFLLFVLFLSRYLCGAMARDYVQLVN